ncbi:MAG TPA: helix-turn-helix domain-containing protein [Spirochaetia bacterium]|nr:helix-turn-helix domain-containing protein [Spirochaetales bacterium]HRW24430.1 helix-turn-helix domain-containing protein [Spirochaetia bacterium]
MDYIINTPSQLTHALRSARKAQGLSQADAGKSVGLLPKTISALENRPASATVDSFLKLLSALELELILKPKRSSSSITNPPSSAGEEW